MEPVITEHDFTRLPALARDHGLHMEQALFDGDWFSVIVWAAVTLEALLEYALHHSNDLEAGGSGDARPDLGGMISVLDKQSKTDGTVDRSLPEVIDRAHSIRVARNMAVHNTGRHKAGLDRQAEKVCDDIRVILDWWLSAYAPETDQLDPPTGSVFLATITPDHPRHRAFLSDLKRGLLERGVQPVSVEMTEYDRKAPLSRVRTAMAECDAVLIVGLERSRAYLVCDREGTPRQVEAKHRRYSSAWLHMEAGLAFGMGLDKQVYVVCEEPIWSEGVFDRDWNEFDPIAVPRLDVNEPDIVETLNRIANAVSDKSALLQ